MFTRLLHSVVKTGLAPKSFYELEDGQRADAHYDGLPVDFLAAAMQQIGERSDAGLHTYNMINLHDDDGISLDTIVDWIETAGYPVRRIEEHGEWLERFRVPLKEEPLRLQSDAGFSHRLGQLPVPS
jgi:fatty acid CoA ligase FadD9